MSGFIREQIVKRATRSSGWRQVRAEHLKKHPECVNCGKKSRFGLQVHHIVPFHVDPSLELDPDNLLTMCGNPRCHLDKGHLGHWHSWNPDVVKDCEEWKLKYRIGKIRAEKGP